MRNFIKSILYPIPVLGTYYKLKTCKYAGFSLWKYFKFQFLTRNKTIYWPISNTNLVANAANIQVGKNCSIGANGCYIQGNGKLIFGDYVRVATNVGIMSGNHNPVNHVEQIQKETRIGSFSWIGMNTVILPGVKLGERTIVAAGSVVTKSFPDGYCIVGGNPAVLIRTLEKEKFIPHTNEFEFYGFIAVSKFKKFKKKHLKDRPSLKKENEMDF